MVLGCVGMAIGMGVNSINAPSIGHSKRTTDHTYRAARWKVRVQNNRVSWAKKHFLLLGHSPDVIPQGVRFRLNGGGYTRPWRLARRLPENHRGQFWLLPEQTQLCMIAWTPEALGEVCSPRKRAIRDGIALVTLPPHSVGPLEGARFLVGVAPIGIEVACVHDGPDARRLPVTAKGTFSLSDWTDSPPTNVTMGSRGCSNNP